MMRQVERKARLMDRDGFVFPVADGVYRIFDPDETEVFTVNQYVCDCCHRGCPHVVAVIAYENRQTIVFTE